MPANNELFAMAVDPVQIALKAGKEPDPWQAELLRSMARSILLNITRQGGKSTMTSILAVYELLFTPNALVLLFSPTLRQSKELFLKIKGIYSLITGEGGYWKERATSVELTLSNGGRIVALPGDRDANIRGYSEATLVLIDEASRVLDTLFYAITPMLAVSGGRMVAMTTPWGRRGFFYEEWTNGGPDWKRFEVPATMCPRITPEFLAIEKRRLPPWVYMQEYFCKFMDTEESVFLHEDIEAMFSGYVEPYFKPGDLDDYDD
jgi:hypothetical protein